MSTRVLKIIFKQNYQLTIQERTKTRILFRYFPVLYRHLIPTVNRITLLIDKSFVFNFKILTVME